MEKIDLSSDGGAYFPAFLDRAAQERIAKELRECVKRAPFYTPTMPKTGKPMSVQMTNLGQLGWVTDKNSGYRYQDTHPVTGKNWPEIPETLTQIWSSVTDCAVPPDVCLVNLYRGAAKMGLHQDKDEADRSYPVVSVSLGDDAVFRLGGRNRKDPTRSFKLRSGDVLVLTGQDRMAHHGIDRIVPGSSTLLKGGGRLNLTMRVAGKTSQL